MSKDIFYNKYIKYKNKYINAKQQMEGGFFGIKGRKTTNRAYILTDKQYRQFYVHSKAGCNHESYKSNEILNYYIENGLDECTKKYEGLFNVEGKTSCNKVLWNSIMFYDFNASKDLRNRVLNIDELNKINGSYVIKENTNELDLNGPESDTLNKKIIVSNYIIKIDKEEEDYISERVKYTYEITGEDPNNFEYKFNPTVELGRNPFRFSDEVEKMDEDEKKDYKNNIKEYENKRLNGIKLHNDCIISNLKILHHVNKINNIVDDTQKYKHILMIDVKSQFIGCGNRLNKHISGSNNTFQYDFTWLDNPCIQMKRREETLSTSTQDYLNCPYWVNYIY